MYSQISLSIQIVPFIFLIKRNRLVKQTVHRFTVTIKKDSIAGQTNRALQYELLLRQFDFLISYTLVPDIFTTIMKSPFLSNNIL